MTRKPDPLYRVKAAHRARRPRLYADHEHYADGPPAWAARHREVPLLTEAAIAARYAGRRYEDV